MGLSQNIINAITMKHSQSVANTFVDKAVFEETLYSSHILDSGDVWANIPDQNNPALAESKFYVKHVSTLVLQEDVTVPNSQGWFLVDRNPSLRIRIIDVNPINLGFTNITNLTVRSTAGSLYAIGTDYTADLAIGTITRVGSGGISEGEQVIVNFDTTAGQYLHATNIIPPFRYGINYSLKLYENNDTYIPSSRQPDDLTDGNNGWVIDYKAGYIYLTTAPVWTTPLKAEFYYYIGDTLKDKTYSLDKIDAIESKLNKHNHVVNDLGGGLAITIKQI